jgi:hypothetical protein
MPTTQRTEAGMKNGDQVTVRGKDFTVTQAQEAREKLGSGAEVVMGRALLVPADEDAAALARECDDSTCRSRPGEECSTECSSRWGDLPDDEDGNE